MDDKQTFTLVQYNLITISNVIQNINIYFRIDDMFIKTVE